MLSHLPTFSTEVQNAKSKTDSKFVSAINTCNVHGAGLLHLLVPVHVEVDGLAVVEGLEAGGVDGGEVDEEVLAATSGGDEAESL